jgi:hypothetical protein
MPLSVKSNLSVFRVKKMDRRRKMRRVEVELVRPDHRQNMIRLIAWLRGSRALMETDHAPFHGQVQDMTYSYFNMDNNANAAGMIYAHDGWLTVSLYFIKILTSLFKL